MITRLYQSLIAAAAVLFLSAASAQETQKEIDGEGWFDRMSKALTSLNFEASLVHVHGDQIEPYQWFQAVGEPQSQELLIRMNGPDFRILRVGNRVAHFHTSASNFSLIADSVSTILPVAFTEPFANIKDTYQVTIGGGARVLGRNAQHLRIISRDNQRYSYSLWVDRSSGMLLKMMMHDQRGEIVEQMQLTSLSIREEAPGVLKEVSDLEMPPLLSDLRILNKPGFPVKPGWQPQGFELITKQSHNLVAESTLVDYYLFSDGLPEYSIYIARLTDDMETDVALSSSQTLFTMRYNDYLITVVGQVPLSIAQRIAQEVR